MSTLDKAFGLVVGIAKYKYVTPLPSTVLNDAQDIHDLLVDPQRCGYLTDNVKLLLNEQATRDEIFKALDAVAARADRESVVFVYVSGHGGRAVSGQHPGEYILPVDASLASDEELAASAISGAEFMRALEAVPARKVVVIFDCCYAAGIKGAGPAQLELKGSLSEQYYDALKAGRGRVVMASSRSDEFSHIVAGSRNSLFTHHLLEGLHGGVASDDGFVRVFDLFEYVQPRVTVERAAQHPVFRAEIEENFAIAVYGGGQKGTVPTVGQGFRYDAFVSFANKEPDSSYAWGTLLPRLKDAGLKIAVAEDVEEPGVARVVNVERAIKQSKRTLILLSDNYLNDRMAEFEDTLAQTVGIKEGTYILLPVKFMPFEENRLSDRIGMLSKINLAHPQLAAQQFDKLVESLKGDRPSM